MVAAGGGARDGQGGRAGDAQAPARRQATERFPRALRVRKRPDYLAIQGTGRKLSGANYLLFARPSVDRAPDRPPDPARAVTRFGATVSRKVGGAVVRNQVKRWIRESCRRLLREFPPGTDVVIVARPSAARAGYGPTAQELATLARRLRGR